MSAKAIRESNFKRGSVNVRVCRGGRRVCEVQELAKQCEQYATATHIADMTNT